MPLLTGYGLLVHGQRQYMSAFMVGIELLHVIADGTEHTQIVKPYHVWTPLPAVYVGKERGVGGHVHDVGIALQVGHEGSLQKRRIVMVPLVVVLAVTGVFAGKDFRSLAVIALIAQSMTEEPVFVTVEVLVN